ncbi:MAG: hypothetical protein LRZ98_01400 [Candidatus Pacebacteria bacterium]|nr:hypothetical protein [Candidatus Paceibacterota bacterium]
MYSFVKKISKKFVNNSRDKTFLEKKPIIDYVFNRKLLRDLGKKYNLIKIKIKEYLEVL